MRSAVIAAYAAMLLLSGCGKAPGPAVAIDNAWSPAAPPGASVIAVYADISAHEPDTLLSVSSPVAASVELHETIENNGMMQMRPVAPLALAKNETVQLAPGGKHLMLMGVTVPLAEGTQIPLTFHFATAGDVSVTAPVRRAQ